jgi:hypothetical protein
MIKVLKIALLGTTLGFALIGTASAQFMPWAIPPYALGLEANQPNATPRYFEGRSVAISKTPRHNAAEAPHHKVKHQSY